MGSTLTFHPLLSSVRALMISNLAMTEKPGALRVKVRAVAWPVIAARRATACRRTSRSS